MTKPVTILALVRSCDWGQQSNRPDPNHREQRPVWFNYIPTVADQIRSDLLDDTHVYFVNQFILNHYQIELGFNEICLWRTEEGSLSFVVVDANKFTYYWSLGRWETTLRNSDTRTINPVEFHNAPNPVAYSQVFTPLPRSSIEEHFSNQVPGICKKVISIYGYIGMHLGQKMVTGLVSQGRPYMFTRQSWKTLYGLRICVTYM